MYSIYIFTTGTTNIYGVGLGRVFGVAGDTLERTMLKATQMTTMPKTEGSLGLRRGVMSQCCC